ncbi:DUF5988 family protein [Saccharothrix sp. MB29]|nr:DUF5988 family protein [Saccharothrix sp. MB29]
MCTSDGPPPHRAAAPRRKGEHRAAEQEGVADRRPQDDRRRGRGADRGVDVKVRVPHASGHEHFTRREESRLVDGEHLPVFTWSYRTKIAE